MAECNARVEITEDRFDEMILRVTRGYKAEVRRSAQAVLGRSRQNIIEMGAIRTGDMYRSGGITYNADGDEAEVGYSMDYSSYVHDGTHRMRARPFLAQAINDQAPETERRLDELLDDRRRL